MKLVTFLALLLVPLAAVCGTDVAKTVTAVMGTEAKAILARHCSEAQRLAVFATLGGVQQDSLGPIELDEREKNLLEGPVAKIQFQPKAFAESGDGSADRPYAKAISSYLKREKPPAGTTLVLAPGHYEEAQMVLPEGVWLIANHKVVLVPPHGYERPTDPKKMKAAPEAAALVALSSRAGIVGLELDGVRAKSIGGVLVLPGTTNAVVGQCHIHDFQWHGIWGDASARQTLVLANRIERIGYSGVRSGSEWLVKNNVIHYAGIVREDGGGGDDGIIPNTRSQSSRILNNLIVARKQPNARHGFGAQMCEKVECRGNLILVEGGIRGGIVFSDGSFGNSIIGNVAICAVSVDGLRTRFGIVINGGDNIVRGNTVIGFGTGLLHHWRDEVSFRTRVNNVFTDNTVFATEKGLAVTPVKNKVEGNRVVMMPKAPNEPTSSVAEPLKER